MTRKHPNSCRSLNRRLNGMTEDEVKDALLAEMDGERRVTVVERLHQRFTALRATRERLELMTEVQRETAQPIPQS
jgi:hypothetical protein